VRGKEGFERVDVKMREDGRRPWGYYEILADLPDCKVKRIVVYPGCRLSLQRHKYRDEHWFVLAGDALVTIDSKFRLIELIKALRTVGETCTWEPGEEDTEG